MTVLLAELTRAAKIVDKIVLGTSTWKELFEEHNFFSLYKYYIRISVCSNMPDAQLQWCGRVQSSIRRLVNSLEATSHFLVVHPLIDGVSSEHLGLSYEEIQGVAYDDTNLNSLSSSGHMNGQANDTDKQGKLYTTKFYIGLLLRATPGRRKAINLSDNIYTFMRHEARGFEHYDKGTMGMTAKVLKRSHLPSDVFKTEASATVLKRTRSQAELDELESESNSG